MRYFKAVGLCLVAMFAVMGLTVASALAETVPTFLFPNGGSTAFTSHTGGGVLTTEKGHEVSCTGATNEGEAVAGTDRAQKITIKFTGCSTPNPLKKTERIKCTTAGAAEGEVRSNALSGELGYIHQGEPLTVGFVLKAEKAGELFAEFKCTSLVTVKVRGRNEGGIIAEVLPTSLNRLIDPGEDAELTFAVEEEPLHPWVQIPRSLTVLGTTISELLLEASVGGGGFELAGVKETENVFILSSSSFEISG